MRQKVLPICEGPTSRTGALRLWASSQTSLTSRQIEFSMKRSFLIFSRSASISRCAANCSATCWRLPSYFPAKSRESVVPEYSTSLAVRSKS